MNWYEKAKKIMDAKGIRQHELLDVFGVTTRGAVGHYLSGRRTPSPEQLRSLAAKLSISIDELMSSAYSAPKADQHDAQYFSIGRQINEAILPVWKIPVISWVQAGEYTEAVDLFQPGYAEEFVDTTIKPKKTTFALRVKGDSMEPVFHEGMILIVDPEMEPLSGDYVVARNGTGEATFKQLVKDGEDYYLKPLNTRYPIKALGDAHIIGVVREAAIKFR